jgi:hypothetical protein
VPGNQTHDALWGIDAREIAGTVERVKPGLRQVRGVPDVMEPRRSRQRFAQG